MSEFGLLPVFFLDRRLPQCLDAHVLDRASSLSNSIRAQIPSDLLTDIDVLRLSFKNVHLFSTSPACLARLRELLDVMHQAPNQTTPIIIFIDVSYEQKQNSRRRSHAQRSALRDHRPIDDFAVDDLYDIHFLNHISSQIQSGNLPRLVVPTVVLRGFESDQNATPALTVPSSLIVPKDGQHPEVRITRYLDAGAVTVLTRPLSANRAREAAAQAYRTYQSFTSTGQPDPAQMQPRGHSWAGAVERPKPFAYLREAMVSDLMSRICHPEIADYNFSPNDINICPNRKRVISHAVGKWSFSAHDFTDDELLYGAWLMLSHAMQMPGLEKWRISDDDLVVFLLACRAAYHDFVLYHNFRHVVDVLQAVFVILVQIRAIPPYSPTNLRPAGPKPLSNDIHSLITPFDAFTLLVSAIGHDVGHPGVNNAFLIAMNAPLAQLYNDRSVLESFHCAAFSQILRRYWPSAFSDSALRRLMINSILATDMGLHFKYMNDLAALQKRLHDSGAVIDGWNQKSRDEYRDLICGLLIKCADISNVAREFGAAKQWALVLTDEFSNQGTMEDELKIPTCLFGGPPERNSIVKLAESQIGFINIFARPLFEGVASILPEVQFGVDQMSENRTVWEMLVQAEQTKFSNPPLAVPADAETVADASGPRSASSSPAEAQAGSLPPVSKTSTSKPAKRKDGVKLQCLSLSSSNGPSGNTKLVREHKSIDKLRHPFSGPSSHTLCTTSPPTTAGHAVTERSAGSYTDSTRPTSREWSTTDEPPDLSPSAQTAHTLGSPSECPAKPLILQQPTSGHSPQAGSRQGTPQDGSHNEEDVNAHQSQDSFFSKRPSRFSLAFWKQWRRENRPGSGSGSRVGTRAPTPLAARR